MTVTFSRVIGIRSKQPSILATVDGHAVRWNSRRGWVCSCPSTPCSHIAAAESLLDPEVLAPLIPNK